MAEQNSAESLMIELRTSHPSLHVHVVAVVTVDLRRTAEPRIHVESGGSGASQKVIAVGKAQRLTVETHPRRADGYRQTGDCLRPRHRWQKTGQQKREK